ncbi:MAG: hypothetical protein HYT93_01680 [Parcubacteria group bacterium]|nr:hypothetical protein [Parcubacteria group bacterium]
MSRIIYFPNWLLKRCDLNEITAGFAMIGMVAHAVGFYLYITFFTDPELSSVIREPLRILDFCWWGLWWLGMMVCMKSGMFNCSRHAWMAFVGFMISFFSIFLTIGQGLSKGVIMLIFGFALIEMCVFLNKRAEKAAKVEDKQKPSQS